MSRMKLQTNENGTAKLCPITTFEVRIATNDMVIVIIQYVETMEQFDLGQPKQLQVVLPAKRARELAATIGRAVKLFQREGSNCLVQ